MMQQCVDIDTLLPDEPVKLSHLITIPGNISQACYLQPRTTWS